MITTINNRYRLLRKIGEGGMGEIFEAVDEQTQDIFAAKLFWSDYAQGEGLQRFQRECKTISQLEHPGIVKVINYGIENGRCYIVMEMAHGSTLQHLIDSSSLTTNKIVETTLQICSALEYIHSNHIIHRDIKPSNIIITSDGTVKIMDFGLAWGRESTSITRTGQIMGTVAYVSPEQAKGKKTDKRSDLYSLGVVLYQALTGRLPFEGGDAVSLIMGHTSLTPLPLRTIKKEIPHSLERIVLKLLAKNPGDRFQSANELREAIEAFKENNDEKINLLTSEITLNSNTTCKQMISRENELKLIKNHLDRLFLKKGGIVLLTGEKGIGKSRLLQEIEKLVNVQMMEFYSVNCHGEPFALGKMIRAIIRSFGKEQLNAELLTDVNYFEKLMLNQTELNEGTLTVLNRLWASLITQLTKELPTILVFDNLREADVSTLNILKSSLNYISDKSLLVIGTVDDGCLEKHPLLRELVEDVTITAKIDLKPFSLSESKDFIKDIFGLDANIAEELAMQFRKKCYGNPLLLQDLVGSYLHNRARRRQIAKKTMFISAISFAAIIVALTSVYFLPEDFTLRKWIFTKHEKNPFKRVEVWLDWQEHPNNPVFVSDKRPFTSPSIIEDQGIYRLWYVGGGKVFYSESSDGVSWKNEKQSTEPIMTASIGMANFDSEEILSVFVLKENNNYKMWYSGFQRDKIPRIGYAVSSDGFRWIKIPGTAYRGAVLDVGEPNEIDESGVSKPSVQKVGDEYFMWYEGKYIASYPFQNTICLAKSADGIIWKREKANPVFTAAAAEIDVFDSRIIGSPSVIYDGKMFRMWYSGSGYGNNIGYAISQDGAKWFRMKHLIFLGALFGSGQKSVSELGRSQPVVVAMNREFKMWFVGTNTDGIQSLAYASSSALEIPSSDIPKSSVVLMNETFDGKSMSAGWQTTGIKTNKRYIATDSAHSSSIPQSLAFYNEEENDGGVLTREKRIAEQANEFILEFDIMLSSPKNSGQWLLGYANAKNEFKTAVDFSIASGEIWSNCLNADPGGRTQMKGSFNYGGFSFEKDKWYNIKTRVNVAQGKFAVWVDGVLLERCLEIGRFSFSNVKAINSLRIGTVENGKTFWIDNLRVISIPTKKE